MLPIRLDAPWARWLTYAVALLFMVVALLPVSGNDPIPGGDKLHHVLGFALLTALLHLSHPRLGWPRVALVMLGYGLLMEALQSLTGYRQAEWADLVADLTGITGALLLVKTWHRGRGSR